MSSPPRGELLAVEDAGRWRTATGPVLLRVPAADGASLLEGDEISAIGRLSRIAPARQPPVNTTGIATSPVRQSPCASLPISRASSLFCAALPHAGFGQLAPRCARLLPSSCPATSTALFCKLSCSATTMNCSKKPGLTFAPAATAHHPSPSAALTSPSFAGLRRPAWPGCSLLHPRNVVVISLLFAICYAAMTRVSPPVVRSVLLCAAVSMAVLFRRNTDPLQCLSLAAIAMLL